MARERIDLNGVYGSATSAQWLSGPVGTWKEVWVRVGQLADGRWWVDATRNPRGALICRDERDAYDLADKWMTKSGRQWEPRPVGGQDGGTARP